MRRASWLKRKSWLLGLGACALLLATPARADGPGIKLGNHLLLHLGLGAEFRYDDNVYFQNTDKVSAFEFVLRPSVDLATRAARGESGNTVDFRLHAGMAYSEFITKRDLLAPNRAISVDAGAVLTLFPTGKFNISLFDNFVRTSQLPYGEEPYNIDRDTNQLGVSLKYSPGSGKRLSIALSYVFGIDFFERDTFQPFNLYTHALALYISWKFFPKTALYLSVSDSINKYQHHDSATFNQPDSYPLHAELGVMGLITPKLALNVYVGYGYGFYVYDQTAIANKQQVDAGSPNTAVGGVNLSWKPTLLSTGNIGYKYDFNNSLLGAYFQVHQAYINWTQLIWRFTGFIGLSYQNVHYFGVAGVSQTNCLGDCRTDNYVSFDLRVDYPFKNWLTASLGYDLQYNATPASLITNPMMPTMGLIPLGYLKNEVWLRLGVLY